MHFLNVHCKKAFLDCNPKNVDTAKLNPFYSNASYHARKKIHSGKLIYLLANLHYYFVTHNFMSQS